MNPVNPPGYGPGGPPERKSHLKHGNHRLEEVEEEKDLGVLIHRTLSVSMQQLCCGGQECEPDGRTHLQNCDTQARAYKLLYHCTKHFHIWSTAH